MTDASTANIAAKTGRSPQDARAMLEGFSPQGRLMTAAEVAALTTFLCSDAAKGINGQGLVLDGGTVQS
jgi:NAD(P)-dependent dehydrogenase (short-subunit alcohol dehydrogenase family)